MQEGSRKIVIIGGGIAGLCAGAYAQQCGYQTEILEMSDFPGGLATSWRRHGYTFELCLHWLLGSKPGGDLNTQWREVFDIDHLTFVDQPEFVRLENEHGESLSVPTSIDRLEREWCERSPRDIPAIRGFVRDLRTLSRFRIPDPTAAWPARLGALLADASCLPLLRRLSRQSARQYGDRFHDPLLRSFFGDGDLAQISAIALLLSLAWMSAGNAGYAVGGSQAIVRGILERFTRLGGQVRCRAKVERILVDRDTAVGVQLVGGETIPADWVISAADGYATVYDLLGGRYTSPAIHKTFDNMETFPSFLQVSLGVAADLSQEPAMLTRQLASPISIDPGTEQRELSFRFFHFDPTFAPEGKTAVTCFLPTRNYDYWRHLAEHNPDRYQAEKDRVAQAVIAVLEVHHPGLRDRIEVVDVSTPATVIRYTGNWKGSMEGWFPVPSVSFRPLPNTLPGLRRFYRVGQWISPGGGLPSGLMTARPAIQAICRQDHVPFLPAQRTHPRPVRHWRLRTP